jgi:acetyl-CoA acyltransferase
LSNERASRSSIELTGAIAVREAYVCDYVRTPIGRFGGSLSSIRTDDLAALPIRALVEHNPGIDWAAIDDVILGCANQAGEDNRNVARMAALLAGLPDTIPGTTINRLCGSGMDAAAIAARAIKAGEADIIIAGGVESMSRAPFVLPKADMAFSRRAEIYDTMIGWRFINPRIEEMYGVDSMPETAENVAADYDVSRADQDAFALRSQQKAAAAIASGRLGKEIVPVSLPQRKSNPILFSHDEHGRPDTSIQGLARLPTPFRAGGTITAGNASSVNDGAAALVIASAEAVRAYGLTPIARLVSSAVAGVAPRVMGIGPVPAVTKLCAYMGVSPGDFDLVELNEAFAAQALVVLRALGIADDAAHVNPNGGAIALGHPLGMSGARLIGTAALELRECGLKSALATMCIGVGQGIAVALASI